MRHGTWVVCSVKYLHVPNPYVAHCHVAAHWTGRNTRAQYAYTSLRTVGSDKSTHEAGPPGQYAVGYVGAAVGIPDGEIDGDKVGLVVGEAGGWVDVGLVEGVADGDVDGAGDGDVEGTGDGDAEGDVDGAGDGDVEGDVDGASVGDAEGLVDGAGVGIDGDTDGLRDGDVEGLALGLAVGLVDGTRVGLMVGLRDGLRVGCCVGNAVGYRVGAGVGTGATDHNNVNDPPSLVPTLSTTTHTVWAWWGSPSSWYQSR